MRKRTIAAIAGGLAIAAALAVYLRGVCEKPQTGPVVTNPNTTDEAAAGHKRTLLDNAEKIAEERWGTPRDRGKSLLRVFVPLESPLLSRYLRDTAVYRAKVFNPLCRIAGPELHRYALAVKGENVWYLDTDKAAADFILEEAAKVETKERAADLALLFGELRDYEVQLRPRTGRNIIGKVVERKEPQGTVLTQRPPVPDDWRILSKEEENGWSTSCTFLVDPQISACRRYAFPVGRDGQFRAEPGPLVFLTGRYR